MNQFIDPANDIGEELNKKASSLKDSFNRGMSETRTDAQHEELATRLAEILGVTDDNLRPYLAASYSGIPRSTLEQRATEAAERGDFPPRLFQHLLKKEPLWVKYQQKRADRKKANET